MFAGGGKKRPGEKGGRSEVGEEGSGGNQIQTCEGLAKLVLGDQLFCLPVPYPELVLPQAAYDRQSGVAARDDEVRVAELSSNLPHQQDASQRVQTTPG